MNRLVQLLMSAVTTWFYNLPDDSEGFQAFCDLHPELPTDQAYDQFYCVLSNHQW